jgi:hypothetical protein
LAVLVVAAGPGDLTPLAAWAVDVSSSWGGRSGVVLRKAVGGEPPSILDVDPATQQGNLTKSAFVG